MAVPGQVIPGGGIYRNVWLVKTAWVHFPYAGIHITTPKVTADAAEVQIVASVASEVMELSTATIRNEIFALNPDGIVVEFVIPSIALAGLRSFLRRCQNPFVV